MSQESSVEVGYVKYHTSKAECSIGVSLVEESREENSSNAEEDRKLMTQNFLRLSKIVDKLSNDMNEKDLKVERLEKKIEELSSLPERHRSILNDESELVIEKKNMRSFGRLSSLTNDMLMSGSNGISSSNILNDEGYLLPSSGKKIFHDKSEPKSSISSDYLKSLSSRRTSFLASMNISNNSKESSRKYAAASRVLSTLPGKRNSFLATIDLEDECLEDDADMEKVLEENEQFRKSLDKVSVEKLEEDIFSLMMVSKVFTRSWWFGMSCIFLQSTLCFMILFDQIVTTNNSTPFNIPIKVRTVVRVGQFFGLLVNLVTQTDVYEALKVFDVFRKKYDWHNIVDCEEKSTRTWLSRVFFPHFCQFFIGTLALVLSFVIVAQADNVMSLFMNITALVLITEIDNIMYQMACQGFFGNRIRIDAENVKEIEMLSKSRKHIQMKVASIIILLQYAGWACVIYGQNSGYFFNLQYPRCVEKSGLSSDLARKNIGNKFCDFALNNVYCSFDASDCLTYNVAFPGCEAPEPEKVGDGFCDGIEYNTDSCNWDGQDCTINNFEDCDPEFETDKFIVGNGICDSILNTEACGYDGGDCLHFNRDYPDCDVEFPQFINNGRCEGGEYNSLACGYDGGDCLEYNSLYINCHAEFPWWIGDNCCDLGLYNTTECNFDGGDCIGEDVTIC